MSQKVLIGGAVTLAVWWGYQQYLKFKNFPNDVAEAAKEAGNALSHNIVDDPYSQQAKKEFQQSAKEAAGIPSFVANSDDTRKAHDDAVDAMSQAKKEAEEAAKGHVSINQAAKAGSDIVDAGKREVDQGTKVAGRAAESAAKGADAVGDQIAGAAEGVGETLGIPNKHHKKLVCAARVLGVCVAYKAK